MEVHEKICSGCQKGCEAALFGTAYIVKPKNDLMVQKEIQNVIKNHIVELRKDVMEVIDINLIQ